MRSIYQRAFLVAQAFSLSFLCVTGAAAASFEFTVNSPGILTELLPSAQVKPLPLGTNLSALYQVTAQISGVHSNGWWVGDRVENFYFGPIGATLEVYLLVGGGVPSVALPAGGWYQGEIDFANDGRFRVDLNLVPTRPYLSSLPYVPNGQVALFLVEWPLVGFGGGLESKPFLQVSEARIELQDSPGIQLTRVGGETVLSWSALPASGVVEILAAPELNGPWQVAFQVPATRSSVTLGPQQSDSRFFRLRWSAAAQNRQPPRLPAASPF